jgi:hypothetical protein
MFGEGEANGNYYATSIPGVSYRIKINGWPSNFNGYFPVTTTYPYNSGSTYVSGGSVYFELIKNRGNSNSDRSIAATIRACHC